MDSPHKVAHDPLVKLVAENGVADEYARVERGVIRGAYRLPAQWRLLLAPEAYMQYTPEVRALVLTRSRAEISARMRASVSEATPASPSA